MGWADGSDNESHDTGYDGGAASDSQASENESQGSSGGGRESGSGSGNTISYSQEAMNAALAAADHQMMANNFETGFASDPNQNAQMVGAATSNYDFMPDAAQQLANLNARFDYKNQSIPEKVQSWQAATAVGQDHKNQVAGLKDYAAEKVGNYMGGTVGGMLGGAFMGPIGAFAGNKLGGQFGTAITGQDRTDRANQIAGLAERVTGSPQGALSKEQSDSMVQRLLKDTRRRRV